MRLPYGFIFIFASATVGSQPTGQWHKRVDGKEYTNLQKPSRNYKRSKQLCKEDGGYLPKPKNHDEYEYLTNEVAKGKTFYLGLIKHAKGVWRWNVDNATVTWFVWENNHTSSIMRRDCVVSSRRRKWCDWGCSLPADAVVCEKKGKSPTTQLTPIASASSKQTTLTRTLANSTGSTSTLRPRNGTTECSDCGTEEKKSFFDSDAVKITGVVLGVAATVFTSVGVISMITGAIPLPFPNPFAPANAPGQVDHGNRGNIENTDNEARNVQKALAKRENSSSSSIGSSSSSYSSFSSSSNTSGSVESKSPEPSDLKNEPT